MSATFDREKAREILLNEFGLPDLPDEIDEATLDALEACVSRPPFDPADFGPEIQAYCQSAYEKGKRHGAVDRAYQAQRVHRADAKLTAIRAEAFKVTGDLIAPQRVLNIRALLDDES